MERLLRINVSKPAMLLRTVAIYTLSWRINQSSLARTWPKTLLTTLFCFQVLWCQQVRNMIINTFYYSQSDLHHICPYC